MRVTHRHRLPRRQALRAVALCVASLTARSAIAQSVTSDALIDRFQPPPPGEYFAGMPFPRYNGDFPIVMRAGVLFRNTLGTPSPAVPPGARIDWQHVAHPMLFFGVHNSVSAYVGLPVLLRSPTDQGSTAGPTRVGDPRFGVRVRIFQHASRAPVSAHLGAEFFLPARWLNGVRDDVFTGVSDGTVRGNVALLLAGSHAFDPLLPIAVSRRFIWSGVIEGNVRPAEDAIRPGSEFHLALGAGVLLPQALHEGWRATLEGHAWWHLGARAGTRVDPVIEGVLGMAFRLPAEFEVLVSGSMATGSWADSLVRGGPVFGINIGLAYAIRDWGAFPLAFDGHHRSGPDDGALRQDPRDAADFGADKRWDRDGDGIPDPDDPCASGSESPQCTDRNRELEAELVRARHGELYPPTTGARPFIVSYDVNLDPDAAVRAIFADDAGIGRLARTIRAGIDSTAGRFDMLLVARISDAERLHPLLRVPGPRRAVWVLDRLVLRAIAAHDATFSRDVHPELLPPELSSCGVAEDAGVACVPIRFTHASSPAPSEAPPPIAAPPPVAPSSASARRRGAPRSAPAALPPSSSASPAPVEPAAPAPPSSIETHREALRQLLPPEWRQ